VPQVRGSRPFEAGTELRARAAEREREINREIEK
jgi:hypothetical protein